MYQLSLLRKRVGRFKELGKPRVIARKAALEASGQSSGATTQRQGEERWAELSERASNPSRKMGYYDAEAQAAAGKLCSPALPRSATGMLNLTRLDNKVLLGGETTIAYLAQECDARHDLLPKAKRSKGGKSLGKCTEKAGVLLERLARYHHGADFDFASALKNKTEVLVPKKADLNWSAVRFRDEATPKSVSAASTTASPALSAASVAGTTALSASNATPKAALTTERAAVGEEVTAAASSMDDSRATGGERRSKRQRLARKK